MASLLTLPPELRREIHSYLLIDHNVVDKFDRKLEGYKDTLFNSLVPHYSTAMFYVNKQLSEEAVDYFYSENAFVLIRWKECDATLHNYGIWEYFSFYRCCIMTHVVNDQYLRKWPIPPRFDVAVDVRCIDFKDGSDHAVTFYSVISARQLSILVKLIQLVAICWQFTLHYRSMGLKMADGRSTLSRVARNANLDLYCEELNPIVKSMDESTIQEGEERKICIKSNEGPKFELDVCRERINFGDKLRKTGFLYEAIGAYSFILWDPDVSGNIIHGDWDSAGVDSFNLALIDASIGLCNVYSKLGEVKEAFVLADAAAQFLCEPWELMEEDSSDDDSFVSRLPTLSALRILLARALTDDGRLGSIHHLFQRVEQARETGFRHDGYFHGGGKRKLLPKLKSLKCQFGWGDQHAIRVARRAG